MRGKTVIEGSRVQTFKVQSWGTGLFIRSELFTSFSPVHERELKNLDRLARASAPAYIGVTYKIPVGAEADPITESRFTNQVLFTRFQLRSKKIRTMGKYCFSSNLPPASGLSDRRQS